MLSFHLEIRFSDRNLRLSFVGHVEDLTKWLASDESLLPKTLEDVGKWTDAATACLTRLFPESVEGPPFGHMLKNTGILLVERKNLSADEFDLQMEEGREMPTVLIREMPSTTRAIALREGRIVPTFGCLIERSVCRRCHQNYATCACIKYVDQVDEAT